MQCSLLRKRPKIMLMFHQDILDNSQWLERVSANRPAFFSGDSEETSELTENEFFTWVDSRSSICSSSGSSCRTLNTKECLVTFSLTSSTVIMAGRRWIQPASNCNEWCNVSCQGDHLHQVHLTAIRCHMIMPLAYQCYLTYLANYWDHHRNRCFSKFCNRLWALDLTWLKVRFLPGSQ